MVIEIGSVVTSGGWGYWLEMKGLSGEKELYLEFGDNIKCKAFVKIHWTNT